MGYVGFLLGPAAMMSAFYFLTQFIQIVLGFGPLATGLAFLPMAGSMFAMTRVVPRLLPKIGPRPLALIGAPLMIAGLAWLTQLSTTSGYAGALLGPMILLGLGGGLTFVPLTPVIMGSVQPREAGAASGVLQTMQQIGATLGLAVLIAVFGAAVGPDGAARHDRRGELRARHERGERGLRGDRARPGRGGAELPLDPPAGGPPARTGSDRRAGVRDGRALVNGSR